MSLTERMARGEMRYLEATLDDLGITAQEADDAEETAEDEMEGVE